MIILYNSAYMKYIVAILFKFKQKVYIVIKQLLNYIRNCKTCETYCKTETKTESGIPRPRPRLAQVSSWS